MKDPFGKWVQEMIPNASENEVKKEIHLAILKERMRGKGIRRRRRSIRTGLIVAPLAVLVLLIGNVVELGGDSFDLVELEGSKTEGRLFEVGHGGGGFNVLEDETEEEIREYSQQIAAGEGVAIGMDGWIINGHELWGITREYSVFGKKMVSDRPVERPSAHAAVRYIVETKIDLEKLLAMVESGNYQPEVIDDIELDGIQFSAQRWSLPTEEYGVVTYYAGEPMVSVFLPKSRAAVEETNFGNVKAMFR